MSKFRNSKTYYYDDTDDFGLIPEKNDDEFMQETSNPSPEAIKRLYETLVRRRDFERIRELFGEEAVENARKKTGNERKSSPAKRSSNNIRKTAKRKIESDDNEDQVFESPSNCKLHSNSSTSAAQHLSNVGQSRMGHQAVQGYATQAFVTPRRTAPAPAVTKSQVEKSMDVVSTNVEETSRATSVPNQTAGCSSSMAAGEHRNGAVSVQEVQLNPEMPNSRGGDCDEKTTTFQDLSRAYSTPEAPVNPRMTMICPSPFSPVPVRQKDIVAEDGQPKPPIAAPPLPQAALPVLDAHCAKEMMSLPMERNPPNEFSDFPACYFLHDVLFV